VFLRSTADLAAEDERRHFVALSVSVGQQFSRQQLSRARQCAVQLQSGLRYVAADVKSYRPITNLSFVSKLLERLVAQQLTTYLTDNALLPDLQSAYLAHYSTETAMVKVVGDILLALDSGNLALLSLLDLSAAFDNVDHDMLSMAADRDVLLPQRCRHQMVRIILERPDAAHAPCRVRSPSRIGPRNDPFLLYVADLLKLIKRHRCSLMPMQTTLKSAASVS